MARVDIPITRVVRTGATPPAQTDGDATNNNSIAYNDGTIFLEVTNTDGAAARTVTVVTPGTVDGLAVSDLVVSVPQSSAVRLIGPFPPGIYNQSDGTVHINPEHANLKFRAYRVS